MRTRGGRGFTLIELLVVIAIIAILAAMLFPVFARARESARKIQCLSNVKNIAAAIQMYLTDYDRLPPTEHRQEVLDYFNSYPGGGGDMQWIPFSVYPDCHRAWQSNPYLRWPVVLDEYVRNRDVWRCASARFVGGAGFVNPDPDWFSYLLRSEGLWGRNHSGPWICPPVSFPKGWGGDITDSCLQQRQAIAGSEAAAGAFEMGISNTHWPELKPGQVDDAAWFVVVCDAGAQIDNIGIGTFVLPDVCGLECAGPGCYPDWDCCPDARSLGLADDSMKTDKTLWRDYTRHLGGSNLGFMDGHASWMRAEAILAAMDPHKYVPADIAQWQWPVFLGKMRGPNEAWGPYTTPDTHQDWSSACGVPPLN